MECTRLRIGRRTVDQLELTGHDRRLGDIDLIASLGVKAVRYPVLWERVAPCGLANADWRWADERLGRLRAVGVRPVVGLLHHGQGPRGVSLGHANFVKAFAAYAGAVARRYPWVTSYVPVNEPLTTARFRGLYGWWAPYAASPAVFARLLIAQIQAVRAAAREIRKVNSDASMIVNEDVGRTFSTARLAGEADLLNERRWLTWDLLLGSVTPEHPVYEWLAVDRELKRALRDLADDPCPPDVLGIDHYVTSDRFLDHRVQMYIPERRESADAPFINVEASRVPGVPEGSVARAISDTWQRYRMPLALTEISLAGGPQDQVAWWNQSWKAALAARKRGVDLRAVTAWATFGATDWHCLMRRPDRVYEPGVYDASFDPPRARPVAAAIRAASGRAPRRSRWEQDAAYAGWWTSPERYSLTIRQRT